VRSCALGGSTWLPRSEATSNGRRSRGGGERRADDLDDADGPRVRAEHTHRTAVAVRRNDRVLCHAFLADRSEGSRSPRYLRVLRRASGVRRTDRTINALRHPGSALRPTAPAGPFRGHLCCIRRSRHTSAHGCRRAAPNVRSVAPDDREATTGVISMRHVPDASDPSVVSMRPTDAPRCRP